MNSVKIIEERLFNMEENYVGVTEEVASPQNDVENTNVENTYDVTENNDIETGLDADFKGVEEEVAEPQNDVENTVDNVSNAQSQEMNSMFAKLRRESEQRGMDRAIAELGMNWNGEAITTYAQYQKALREQALMEEAQQQGIDPQFYTDFRNMQEEVQAYRQEKTFMEQDKELSGDSVRGQFYNSWKDEIREMATTFGVDLKTAFTLTLENKLPEILNAHYQKAQNETIKKINQNGATSVGSLSQQGDNPSVNAWDMNQEEFEKMLEKAKSGSLRKY